MPASVLTMQVFVPGPVSNPLNTHGTTRRRIGEGLRWKRLTRVAWLRAGRPRWDNPAVVQFTVYVARLWDHEEGLGAAVKYVRDEAVRLILDGSMDPGKPPTALKAPANDGPESGHVFLPVKQEQRPHYRGVLIEVSPR